MSSTSLLFVDDEAQLLSICREVFEAEGYAVHLANNGLNALRVLRKQNVDAVVTDLKMPGLDGLGLLKQLKRTHPALPVVVLTGYGAVESAVECLRLGAADYLQKPFQIDALLEKVKSVIANAAHGAATTQRPARRPGLEDALRAGQALAKESDPNRVIRELVSQLKKIFEPDDLALWRFAEAPTRAEPLAVRGPLLSRPEIQRPLARKFADILAEGREEMILSGEELGRLEGLGSIMTSPLAVGERRLGLLVLHREPAHSAFTHHELKLLTLLATQAGSILEMLNASRRLSGVNLEVVTSLARAVEAKDFYTRGHSDRVSRFALRLGRRIGLPSTELFALRQGALLHDVGKIGVPDHILNKPGRLDVEELDLMRCHPGIGRDILSHVSALRPVLDAVYHHHEHFDGRGYPEGLAGDEIPLSARIIAVVDSFEAIISHRAYQRARELDEARDILQANAGPQWDPRIVEAWLRLIDQEGVEKLSEEEE